eukprot:scaffold4643_cov174-Skeletonema_menzelii.AAC.2
MSNCSGAITTTAAFAPKTYSRLERPRTSSAVSLRHVGEPRSRLFSSISSADGDTASSEKETSVTVAVPSSSLSSSDEEINQDEEYFDKLFDSLAKKPSKPSDETVESDIADETEDDETVKLVDFIEQSVGIQPQQKGEQKRRRGRAKTKDIIISSFSVAGKEKPIKLKSESTALNDTNSDIVVNQADVEDAIDSATTAPVSLDETIELDSDQVVIDNETSNVAHTPVIMEEQPPPRVNEKEGAPYNVVCTHITADFDTLASAIGLAKLWSLGIYDEDHEDDDDSIVNGPLPTYVVLPRGAHPDVQRFLSLHKHLFPIRSMKSLPGFSDSDLKKAKNNNDSGDPNEGLQRVGLVDAQRRDRLGPADVLLPHAKLGVTIVDHHVDAESDIPEANNYIVENVGSVSTMIAERLKRKNVDLTEAEATILALGIHSDTGSLIYDSTTPKDASMLGWAMEMGASQAAIAEHAKPTLSDEQQSVLTQALVNFNTTTVHGVTIATVLLSADGFIPGLATVTKDALDLSSSDVFILAVCYEATRGAKGGGGKKGKQNGQSTDKLQKAQRKTVKAIAGRDPELSSSVPQLLPGVEVGSASNMINSESWKGGELAFTRQRLAATFAFYDTDRSGYLEKDEILQALKSANFVISEENFNSLIASIDTDGDGKIDFEEFVNFYTSMEERKKWESIRAEMEGRLPGTPSTMTIIGRVKAGVNVRNVNLNRLFQQFNGGGHPKAASATAKLEDESEAEKVLQGLVDELIETSLDQQLRVGDFMQSPVLSAKPTMTEKQIEDLFIRYDVRALPVVDDNNEVIGLVSYKEVSAAKMRLINKQEKRLRQIEKAVADGRELPENRPLESAVKGWMKQKVELADASMTMAEVEQLLLETDVGCVPVVAEGTKQLVGMVTRTDLLRQHRYYSSLHYHNKGFSDSIAARKPIIELRKRLKKFDVENE